MKQFFKDMFSSSGNASFGRVATLITILVGCWSLIHIVRHNHALPDALTLGALAAWMTSPYAINKVTALFGGAQSPAAQAGTVQLQASAETVESRRRLAKDLLIGFAWLCVVAVALAQMMRGH